MLSAITALRAAAVFCFSANFALGIALEPISLPECLSARSSELLQLLSNSPCYGFLVSQLLNQRANQLQGRESNDLQAISYQEAFNYQNQQLGGTGDQFLQPNLYRNKQGLFERRKRQDLYQYGNSLQQVGTVSQTQNQYNPLWSAPPNVDYQVGFNQNSQYQNGIQGNLNSLQYDTNGVNSVLGFAGYDARLDSAYPRSQSTDSLMGQTIGNIYPANQGQTNQISGDSYFTNQGQYNQMGGSIYPAIQGQNDRLGGNFYSTIQGQNNQMSGNMYSSYVTNQGQTNDVCNNEFLTNQGLYNQIGGNLYDNSYINQGQTSQIDGSSYLISQGQTNQIGGNPYLINQGQIGGNPYLINQGQTNQIGGSSYLISQGQTNQIGGNPYLINQGQIGGNPYLINQGQTNQIGGSSYLINQRQANQIGGSSYLINQGQYNQVGGNPYLINQGQYNGMGGISYSTNQNLYNQMSGNLYSNYQGQNNQMRFYDTLIAECLRRIPQICGKPLPEPTSRPQQTNQWMDIGQLQEFLGRSLKTEMKESSSVEKSAVTLDVAPSPATPLSAVRGIEPVPSPQPNVVPQATPAPTTPEPVASAARLIVTQPPETPPLSTISPIRYLPSATSSFPAETPPTITVDKVPPSPLGSKILEAPKASKASRSILDE